MVISKTRQLTADKTTELKKTPTLMPTPVNWSTEGTLLCEPEPLSLSAPPSPSSWDWLPSASPFFITSVALPPGTSFWKTSLKFFDTWEEQKMVRRDIKWILVTFWWFFQILRKYFKLVLNFFRDKLPVIFWVSPQSKWGHQTGPHNHDCSFWSIFNVAFV